MSEFKTFRNVVAEQQSLLFAQSELLYEVDLGIKPFDLYLDSFSDDERQQHNCNTCKSWLNNLGNVIGIVHGKRMTMWDFVCNDPVYEQVRQAMHDACMRRPIAKVYTPVQSGFGTERNTACLEDGTAIIWEHFNGSLSRRHMITDSKAASYLSNYEVLKRTCREFQKEPFVTVLDLIDNNDLLRGEQFKNAVVGLYTLWTDYQKATNKEVFLWSQCNNPHAKVRNTSIGQLLIDLNEGVDTSVAVDRYEKMVGGANYKRPKALITQAQRDRFKEAMQGYALQRRYAVENELPLQHVSYAHRVTGDIPDMLDVLDAHIVIDPDKVKHEQIDIKTFMAEKLPNAHDLEMLVEPKHFNKFAALMTGNEPSIVAWENPFTLSYSGSVADSIKERVRKAGGNVEAELRVSLSWGNSDDLDLHCKCPDGYVYFGDRKGILDVDMNQNTLGDTFNEVDPVENCSWTNPRSGNYNVWVNQYFRRGQHDKGFTVQVAYRGDIVYEQYFPTSPRDGEDIRVISFKITKGSIVIDGKTSKGKGTIRPEKKWGITTHRWIPVHHVFVSPNFWTNSSGNKHYFFHSRDMQSDEQLTGLFNEQIKPEIHRHHKNAVELLGALVKCNPVPNAVCGVSLSETQQMDLLVRGTFDGKPQTFLITKK